MQRCTRGDKRDLPRQLAIAEYFLLAFADC